MSLDAQVQHIGHFGGLRTVSGFSVASIESEQRLEFNSPFFPDPPPSELDAFQSSIYAYSYFSYPEFVHWTAGFSVDRYDDDAGAELDRSELSPKFGVEVDVVDGVTLRGAYLRSVNKRLVSEQTLEPTTIAGFEQFDETVNATRLERLGAGIDVRLSDTIRMGAEGTATWFDIPIVGLPDAETREREIRGYLGVAMTDELFLTLEASHQRVRSDFFADFPEYDVTRGSASLRYFHPIGLFALAEVEVVDQDVLEFPDFFGNQRRFEDTFPVVNAAVGVRLANGRGVISVEVQNLLDQEFGFQERNIRRDIVTEPSFARDLTVMARATFRF